MSKGEPKQESIAIVMKTCSRCNRELPATSEYFYRNRRSKDGLSYVCKGCQNELARNYRNTEKGKQVLKKSVRKYQLKNRNRILQYNRKYRKNHPHRTLRIRINSLRHTLIDYFLKKYCEYGDYILRYEFLYEHLSQFAEKFHITLTKVFMTYHLRTQNDAISFLYDTKGGRRVNQKKLKGIRFNKKGKKQFGTSNLCNLEIDPHEIHSSQEACIKLSCEFGQSGLKELYDSCSPELQQKIDYDATLKCYKQIESYLFKINKIRDTSVKIATALWISNKAMIQRECASLSGSTTATLRNLYKLLKIEKDEYLVKEGIVEI